MIVKLKCVDNEGYDYFTVGTYIRHGEWEVVNE